MLSYTVAVVVVVFSNIYCTLAGEGCITKIDLYAGTGGIKDAQSKADFAYEFNYKTDARYSQTIELYDRSGNDMTKNQGDFWTLEGPEVCVQPDQIQDNSKIKMLSGRDGWYVNNAITYGELDGDETDLILISHNYGVNAWADNKLIPPNNEIALPNHYIVRDNCAIKDRCIQNIYIMAVTGDDRYDGSQDLPQFTINDKTFDLKDNTGNDMARYKADLWKVTAEEAKITSCMMFGEVYSAEFHAKEGSKDGWLIKDAIVTVQLAVKHSESPIYALLAGNRDLNGNLDTNSGKDTIGLTMKNIC